MADMRKATLSVNVAIDAAMKNIQSIKTQFQSLDKLATKNLTTNLKGATDGSKSLAKTLKDVYTSDIQKSINGAANSLQDAKAGAQGFGESIGLAAGVGMNSMGSLGSTITKAVLGPLGLAVTAAGALAAVFGTIYSAAGQAVSEAGTVASAEALAKQRGYSEQSLADLNKYLNTYQDDVSSANLKIMAANELAFNGDEKSLEEHLNTQSDYFSKWVNTLGRAGITDPRKMQEMMLSSPETFSKLGMINLQPGEIAQFTGEAQQMVQQAGISLASPGADAMVQKVAKYLALMNEMKKQNAEGAGEVKTIQSEWYKLGVQFSNLSEKAGTHMMPILTKLVSVLGDVLNAAEPMVDAFGNWLDEATPGIIAFIDQIEKGVGWLLKMAGAVVGIARSVGGIRIGGSTIGATFQNSMSGIGAVTTSISRLQDFFTAHMHVIEPAIVDITKAVYAIGHAIESGLNLLINAYNTVYDFLQPFISKAEVWFGKAFDEYFPKIVKFGEDLWGLLSGSWDAVTSTITTISTTMTNVYNKIGEVVTGILNFPGAVAKALKDWMPSWAGGSGGGSSDAGRTDSAPSGDSVNPEWGSAKFSGKVPGVGAAGSTSSGSFTVTTGDYSSGSLKKSSQSVKLASAAIGGTTLSDGIMAVHSSEEILRATDVSNGPGVIAQAISQLQQVTANTAHTSAGSAQGPVINLTVNYPNYSDRGSQQKIEAQLVQLIRDEINRLNLLHQVPKRGYGFVL